MVENDSRDDTMILYKNGERMKPIEEGEVGVEDRLKMSRERMKTSLDGKYHTQFMKG